MIDDARLKQLLTWLNNPMAFIAMGVEEHFKVWQKATMHRGDHISAQEFGRMEADGLVQHLPKAEGGKYNCHAVITDAGRERLKKLSKKRWFVLPWGLWT